MDVGGSCAWAISDDLPKTINDFGGEQAEFGPLLRLDYGFVVRYNDFASGRISNSCP